MDPSITHSRHFLASAHIQGPQNMDLQFTRMKPQPAALPFHIGKSCSITTFLCSEWSCSSAFPFQTGRSSTISFLTGASVLVLCFLRRLRRKTTATTVVIETTPPTPTPIPAFAPLESPSVLRSESDSDDDGVAVLALALDSAIVVLVDRPEWCCSR